MYITYRCGGPTFPSLKSDLKCNTVSVDISVRDRLGGVQVQPFEYCILAPNNSGGSVTTSQASKGNS